MSGKTVVPLMVRLPEELHERLTQSADKAGRSLNQELTARLEHSFVRDKAETLLKQAEDREKRAAEVFNLITQYQNTPPYPGPGLLGPLPLSLRKPKRGKK